jgi:beta-glucanase (GH16 family)
LTTILDITIKSKKKMRELILLSLLFISATSNPYVQVFKDSFQNLDNWNLIDQPGSATGNNEWEYYTTRSSNVYIQDLGNNQHALVLQALREDYKDYHYTSGKVISKNHFGPYGFFNIHAKVPKGNGIWPAIWLLPEYSRSVYGSWAACGEIDIMETVCSDGTGYSTLQFGGPWPKNVQYPYPPNNAWYGVDWNVPHKFGVEWQPGYMKFWIDAEVVNGQIQGRLLNEITSDKWYSLDSNGNRYPGNAPFDQSFTIILNLAICGNWPISISGCCDNIPNQTQMTVYDVEVWEMLMMKTPTFN